MQSQVRFIARIFAITRMYAYTFRHAPVRLGLTFLLFHSIAIATIGQDRIDPAGENDLVELSLPENMEVKVLITLVSDQLGIRVFYDEKVANKKVTIKTPTKVPKESLQGLLESALKMKGLALVEDDQPGWYRVVESTDLVKIARPPEEDVDPRKMRPTAAVTQVFVLEHADSQRVDGVIKPFLSQPGGNSIVVQERKVIIVTDYASNLVRVQEMIELLDQERREIEVAYVPIRNMTAKDAAEELRKILAAKHKAQGVPATDVGLEILEQDRRNQLVLVGEPKTVAEARGLLTPIDISLGLETKLYRFATASPKEVDELTRNLIGEMASEQLYQSAVQEEAGLLIVTTTPVIHEQVAVLQEDFDREMATTIPVVRFYKLENAKASDVLGTISSLEGVGAVTTAANGGPDAGRAMQPNDSQYRIPPPGPNRPPPPEEGGLAPQPRVFQEADEQDIDSAIDESLRPLLSGAASVQTPEARIVAHEGTNTIIVVGDESVQQLYAELIQLMDRRRPQVLIEVTLVTLDFSETESLGVEISRTDDNEKARILKFSSFGLSEVDPDTGRLTLTPGLGFNGAVISSDIADIIVRALKTNGRSKIVSAPKILVNDNANGSLTSALDAPFTSVNASNTVSTTSFGGFESAGTTIDVTPHISEGDHLTLEYSVQLSAFGEGGTDEIPPPRQRNDLTSEVTIPDGYTIIVGGLNRADFSETITRVPILGEIPYLEYLFSNRTKNDSNSTLFVFIRPVILRDDQFQDLKYLSQRDLAKAQLPQDMPESEPLLMR